MNDGGGWLQEHIKNRSRRAAPGGRNAAVTGFTSQEGVLFPLKFVSFCFARLLKVTDGMRSDEAQLEGVLRVWHYSPWV